MYKPGGFCPNRDCSCQHGSGWVCEGFKAMEQGDEYCAECGYDRADHDDRFGMLPAIIQL